LASATVGAAQPSSDEGVTTIGPLLERRQELARIESALAEAREGRGRFLVIEGPAGIGKTALLATARTVAADGGMRVLRSRGAELERDFAFGVVRQLFEAVLAEASELERADLLEGGAGVAAGLLGLPGAPPAEGPSASGVDPSVARGSIVLVHAAADRRRRRSRRHRRMRWRQALLVEQCAMVPWRTDGHGVGLE